MTRGFWVPLAMCVVFDVLCLAFLAFGQTAPGLASGFFAVSWFALACVGAAVANRRERPRLRDADTNRRHHALPVRREWLADHETPWPEDPPQQAVRPSPRVEEVPLHGGIGNSTFALDARPGALADTVEVSALREATVLPWGRLCSSLPAGPMNPGREMAVDVSAPPSLAPEAPAPSDDGAPAWKAPPAMQARARRVEERASGKHRVISVRPPLSRTVALDDSQEMIGTQEMRARPWLRVDGTDVMHPEDRAMGPTKLMQLPPEIAAVVTELFCDGDSDVDVA